MNKLTYEEIIRRDGKYIFTPVGTSMLPLLRQRRDTVLVEDSFGIFKKNDVVLYKRKSGEYILHRILKIENDSFTMCGDNQTDLEKGIRKEQILGVMTAFWRGEKMVKTTNTLYRLYTNVWCFSLRLRRIMLSIYRRLFK